jgi:8-oxo-dGTP diphosphatase
MNHPTHFVSVAALVTNDRGEILLVKSPWRGWEYPGGLIEPGETFREALHREVREEAGVEIEITGFVGICKNVERNIVNIDFTAKYLSGELRPSEESTEVIWATPEEAFRLIQFPLTRKRLENMLSGREEATLFCFEREKSFRITEDHNYAVGNKKK